MLAHLPKGWLKNELKLSFHRQKKITNPWRCDIENCFPVVLILFTNNQNAMALRMFTFVFSAPPSLSPITRYLRIERKSGHFVGKAFTLRCSLSDSQEKKGNSKSSPTKKERKNWEKVANRLIFIANKRENWAYGWENNKCGFRISSIASPKSFFQPIFLLHFFPTLP